MCGRFMFEPKKNPEINRIYELATSNGYQPKTGEVYPSDQTALVIPGTHQVQVVAMKWGFPGFKPGQLIINARSETVNDKKMFADSFKARRCVYPTTGFFEWSKDKANTGLIMVRIPNRCILAVFTMFFRELPRVFY